MDIGLCYIHYEYMKQASSTWKDHLSSVELPTSDDYESDTAGDHLVNLEEKAYSQNETKHELAKQRWRDTQCLGYMRLKSDFSNYISQ